MPATKVMINRAPVMTLWAAVVAEHLGFDRAAALTMAKVVTGLNAQAKGQRLGIYEPASPEEKAKYLHQRPAGETIAVALLGRQVQVMLVDGELRAVQDGKPLQPDSVERYLAGKFGDNLADVRAAMDELAASMPPEQLAGQAYHLYEKFRPVISAGVTGWGAAGELDLDYIRSLSPRP
jgi:hypothetical protein